MIEELLKKTPAFIWPIKHWYLMTEAWDIDQICKQTFPYSKGKLTSKITLRKIPVPYSTIWNWYTINSIPYSSAIRNWSIPYSSAIGNWIHDRYIPYGTGNFLRVILLVSFPLQYGNDFCHLRKLSLDKFQIRPLG